MIPIGKREASCSTATKFCKNASLIFLLNLAAISLSAQAAYDTAFYKSYTNKITGRFYFSQKYTALRFNNKKDNFKLNYRPNTTLNMGVGATYKWATLNLAYGFGFLNPDNEKGKTKYLDLQFHKYEQKYTIDLLGQFYRGFFLNPKGLNENFTKYYIRPDMRINVVGGSYQYVLNNKRFSYRAAFLQNQWQRKSAGSLLLGFEAYGGRLKTDSTLIPFSMQQEVSATLNVRKINFFNIGPNVGYAYSLIIKKNFFIMGSASVSFDYGRDTYKNTSGGSFTISGFTPNTFVRFFTGYNSYKYAISAVYINNSVQVIGSGVSSDLAVKINAGNYRLNFIYRFKPSRKIRKYLKMIK